MRNKVNAVLISILFALLTAMCVCAFKIREKKVDGVLLAVPNRPFETGVDMEKLEDLNGADYILTYDTSRSGKLETANKNIDAVVIGTNHLCANVMNMPLISGSFFMKAAREEKRKLAVLNEKAAFELLGGMDAAGSNVKIDGIDFTVCGVVQDGDKKGVNVYVPLIAELGFSQPDAFAAALDGGTETAKEEITNKMKNLGTDESSHNFYRLSDFSGAVVTKLKFSVKLAVMVIVTFFFLRSLGLVRRHLQKIRELNEQYDPGDLIKNGKLSLFCITFGAVVLAGSVVLMVFTLLSCTSDFLFIIDVGITIASDFSPGFEFLIGNINILSMYSHFSFLGYIVVLFIAFAANILFIFRKER